MLEYLPDKQVFSEVARWGADQELEACCAEVSWNGNKTLSVELRAARRPSPPTLKEQALAALHAVETCTDDYRSRDQHIDAIFQALMALPDA
jgi:hypothetical protein